MSTNDYPGLALASLRESVAGLRDDLRSSRNREFAACVGRVLSRLHIDMAAAPALAAQHLQRWRRLTGTAPADAPAGPALEPLQELHRHAAQVGRSLQGPTAPTAAWFKEAVTATRDYLDAYERAFLKDGPRIESEADDTDTQLTRLARYLSARYPALPPNPVRSLRIVPGGRAKQTSLLELAPNPVLPTRLVLRRDLSLSVTGASAYAEFPLLQTLTAMGLPVPQPVLAEKDPQPLGGSFIVMKEIENARVGGELFAELNDLSLLAASFAPDLVRAMAQLHTLRAHPSGTDLAGHAGGGTDPLDMVRGFQELFNGIAHKPPMHLATQLGFAWLLANPLPKTRPHRLVHGDIGLHNILVRGGALAALLDWELAHLGDPAEDIAYAWTPLLRHLLSWDAFAAHYLKNGGDAEAYDRHAVAWYGVWAYTRNSVYVTMHYDWTASGRRKDIESFNAATDFFARTQYYIAFELDEALKDSPDAH